MPNANYQRGVRFERERLLFYKEVMKVDAALRTAGSHGVFDLVIFSKGHVQGIQCKVVVNPKVVRRMLHKFRASPPLIPSNHFHQTLEVKVTGSTEVHSVTV